MLITFLDLETTGLNHTSDKILEIAVALWWCKPDANRMVRSFSCIMNDDLPTVILPNITKINGITEPMREERGMNPDGVFKFIYPNFIEPADYICAHNAVFDRAFIEAELNRLRHPPWETPWLCTKENVDYPKEFTSRRLHHLAAEHGFMNPFPHEAMGDIMTTAKILSKYNIQEVVAGLSMKKVMLSVAVAFHEKDKQQVLRDNGFRWDGENKHWKKVLKENVLEEELARLTSFGITPKVINQP